LPNNNWVWAWSAGSEERKKEITGKKYHWIISKGRERVDVF